MSNQRTQLAEKLLDKHPSAGLVKNRYKAIRAVLKQMYPTVEVENNRLEDMIFDAIALDRKLRDLTQGQEQETKTKLSQEWQIAHDRGKI